MREAPTGADSQYIRMAIKADDRHSKVRDLTGCRDKERSRKSGGRVWN